MSLNRDEILQGEKEPLSSSYATSIKRMQESHAEPCQRDYFDSVDKSMLYNHFFPKLEAKGFLDFSATNKSNRKMALQYPGYIELVNPAKIDWLRKKLDKLDEKHQQLWGLKVENKPVELGDFCAYVGICGCGSGCTVCFTMTGIGCFTASSTNCIKMTAGVCSLGTGIVLGLSTIATTLFFGTGFANRCFRNQEKYQIEEEIKNLEIRKNI